MRFKIFFCFLFIMPMGNVFSQGANDDLRVGAECVDGYIDLLRGKKVGVVANQASLIGKRHLVDSLISLGLELELFIVLNMGLGEMQRLVLRLILLLILKLLFLLFLYMVQIKNLRPRSLREMI
ncbi:MAG: hypothetical protein PHO12_06630 [Bacteroidales bacterium]|nr:hypothetical protein [Bacteroidales bacterium]